MFGLSRLSFERLDGVHPQLVFILQEVLSTCVIDFAIPEFGGVRSDETQNKMFERGSSKSDGYVVKSRHQICESTGYGMAVDIVPLVNNKGTYDPVPVAIAGSAIMTLGNALYRNQIVDYKMRWGLTFGSNEFKGWDGCHFEFIEHKKNV